VNPETTRLRVFRLRQPSRTLVRMTPVWLVVLALGGVAMAVLVLVRRVPNASSAAIVATDLAVVLVWFVVLGLYARMYARTIREAAVLDTGAVELVPVIGRAFEVRPGQVRDVRVQQFLPQPGYTRVRTDTRVLYLGPFEDLDLLLESLGPAG
jgi:hypothetical protein